MQIVEEPLTRLQVYSKRKTIDNNNINKAQYTNIKLCTNKIYT